MAAVRGIGVAVITSRSGSPSAPLARSVARCSTPKRCCSSITTHPSDPNATSSVNSACVPTTMPTSPDARPSRTAARAFPFTRLVSSSTRTSPPAMPPGPSRSPRSARTAEKCCSASTSVGTMQRALVPALHRAQQGGQRDDGLARPHVALEEAVHGERPGHVGHDHRQRPPLRLRELVGQAGQEARHEGVGDRTGDLARRHVVMQRAGVHLEGTAPQHQRQLQTEELVEHEPSPRRFDHLERLGHMDGAERLGPPPQTERRPPLGRQRVRELARPRQRLLHELPDLPRRQPDLGRGGVHGQDAQRPPPRGHAGHDVDDRVDHLARAPVLAHLAEEDRLGARLELLGPPGLVEEDDGQPSRCRRAPSARPRARPFRARRERTDCTDASTAASSPTSSPETSAWRVRSM